MRRSISPSTLLSAIVVLLAGTFARAAPIAGLDSKPYSPSDRVECSTGERQEHQSDKPVKLSSQQLLRLVKKRTALMPPGMLHDSKLHGNVTVEVCIDDTGTLTRVTGIRGHPFAISSAIESVARWTFVPYQQNGVPRCAFGLLTLRYDWRTTVHQQ